MADKEKDSESGTNELGTAGLGGGPETQTPQSLEGAVVVKEGPFRMPVVTE